MAARAGGVEPLLEFSDPAVHTPPTTRTAPFRLPCGRRQERMGEMLKRIVFTALAAAATLAFSASAHAAYLTLGTSNTSNATTALSGSTAGPELTVTNTNGSAAADFGLYGLLTATAPTASAAAVRGHNGATNALGYGVWGSQAGSGTGVYGYTPSGRGVYGLSSSGTGVRGASTTGTGVLGQHLATTGTLPGVEGLTSSTSASASGVYGASGSSARGV